MVVQGGTGERVPLLDSERHGKNCDWVESCTVVVASMLGTGVLGLPLALRQTGWGLGLGWLFAVLSMSIYSGIVLWRLYMAGHKPHTYADLVFEVFERRFGHRCGVWARSFVILIAYSYLFGVCCIFVTAMKISLQELMWNLQLSELGWLVCTAIFIFPFVQVQSLHEASFMTLMGVATIIAVNGIVVGQVVKILYTPENGGAVAAATTASVGAVTGLSLDRINGLTAIAFAFGGHVIFLEVLSEMKRPQDFRKALFTSQGIMLSNYLLIGVFGFLAYGAAVQSPITMSLPSNTVSSKIAHLCLMVHVLVAYCIESYVIVIGLEEFLDSKAPRIREALYGKSPKIGWAVLSGMVLVGSVVVAFCVPNFGDLMSLYSSIGIFSLSFAVPPLLWMVYNYDSMTNASVVLHSLLVVGAGTAGLLGLGASAQTILSQLRMRFLAV